MCETVGNIVTHPEMGGGGESCQQSTRCILLFGTPFPRAVSAGHANMNNNDLWLLLKK